MLVTPASIALLVTRRMTTMLGVAMVFEVASALGGLTLSYHLASPSGATIVLVACEVLVAVRCHHADAVAAPTSLAGLGSAPTGS